MKFFKCEASQAPSASNSWFQEKQFAVFEACAALRREFVKFDNNSSYQRTIIRLIREIRGFKKNCLRYSAPAQRAAGNL